MSRGIYLYWSYKYVQVKIRKIMIYYFTGKLGKFYWTKGPQARPILLTKHPERSEANLVEGTCGLIFLIFSKECFVHNCIVFWNENARIFLEKCVTLLSQGTLSFLTSLCFGNHRSAMLVKSLLKKQSKLPFFYSKFL